MNAISTFVACIIGAFCWFFTLLLFDSGAGPIGGADSVTWVVFLAPFGFWGSLMVRYSHQKHHNAVLWVLALFPLLSIATNVGLFMMAVLITELFRFSLSTPNWLSKEAELIVVALMFWSVIAAGLITSGWTSPKEMTKQ